MNLFPWQKPKPLFDQPEIDRIVSAVREAEQRTSGEIRVFVENHCRYMDAIDRAVEIFYQYNMQQTAARNAVVIYVALQDHQLAIYGDEGIHNKVGEAYWQQEVQQMISEFNKEHISEGIRVCVMDIGEALHTHFPYQKDSDKNELPDDIIFGH